MNNNIPEEEKKSIIEDLEKQIEEINEKLEKPEEPEKVPIEIKQFEDVPFDSLRKIDKLYVNKIYDFLGNLLGLLTDTQKTDLTDGGETTLHTHAPAIDDALKLKVYQMQLNPATGTCTNPTVVNDGSIVNPTDFTLNEYAEIKFECMQYLTQYRQAGATNNNGDGFWKIQYYKPDAGWTDWITDIPTRTLDSFGDWASGSTIYCSRIRLICTKADTGANSNIRELELKY